MHEEVDLTAEAQAAERQRIEEFLTEEMRSVEVTALSDLGEPGATYRYREVVFTQRLAALMLEHAYTCGEPTTLSASFQVKVGNADVRISGWAVSSDGEEMDLIVSDFSPDTTLQEISREDLEKLARLGISFIRNCVNGKLLSKLDPSHEILGLVSFVAEEFPKLQTVRIWILSNRYWTPGRGGGRRLGFQAQEVDGKDVRVEVMDIGRQFRSFSAGRPRDEVTLDFEKAVGAPLPCLYVPGDGAGCDALLVVLPGAVIAELYRQFGEQLLEANVRSFLSITGKVNAGIRRTLRYEPERFLAYNNGLVIVVDRAEVELHGAHAELRALSGIQIVNGGQTTASLHFARRNDHTDLGRVRVPAKVLILPRDDTRSDLVREQEEALIGDVSRYANSQNAVKASDLSARHPFHRQMETLANQVEVPIDDTGGPAATGARWFYERAAGSYRTTLNRDGSSPALRRRLSEQIIPSRRCLTKTDLAKYRMAWDQRPDVSSLGGQKCFTVMMRELGDDWTGPISVDEYKRMIAQAILYRKTELAIKDLFKAYRGNIAPYTVALISHRLGGRLELMRIWNRQNISPELRNLIRMWAPEVFAEIVRNADGKNLSERPKREECWVAVRTCNYPSPAAPIPELSG